MGCNTLNYFFTLVVFSLAVSTIKKEGSPNLFHSHSKMGLAMLLLDSFQVAGGLFRPSKEVESVKTKKAWELAHNILGLMLFLFGVWQMYPGMVLYKSRYDNSNFIAVAVFYIFWMGMWTVLIAFISSCCRFDSTIKRKGVSQDKKRQVWELAHNISGLLLFLFGVWQMYAGMVLHRSRYDNSNFIAVAVFYIFWMGMWTALIAGVTVYKWKSRQVEEKSADETKH